MDEDFSTLEEERKAILRITSYNVCYTKLLRTDAERKKSISDSFMKMEHSSWKWPEHVMERMSYNFV